MIDAASFIRIGGEYGFDFYTGVPCSSFKPFINLAIDSPDVRYVGAANEGDAVAIASGASLAGAGAVVMLQNSGLGNAVNPLVSLNHPFKIPILLIVSWRGEPGGAPDEPQHQLMGAITPHMLDLMQIPWEHLPAEEHLIEPILRRARMHMQEHGTPFALIARSGSVKPYRLRSHPHQKSLAPPSSTTTHAPGGRFTRAEMLATIQRAARPDDLLLATTGYTGRELYALDDRPSQFYMVGSMGCISSIGLGIALVRSRQRVIAIDGDGAALMRLGALTTVGYERPPNMVHILLDNQQHESTGGQATVSHSIDFCAIARACGYQEVIQAVTPDDLRQAILAAGTALTFVHVPIISGTRAELPRPTVSPVEVARRFTAQIQEL